MSNAKKLSDELSVCSFVTPAELPQFAHQFRTIINNRPDAEEPGQPTSADIEVAARELGLQYVHIPVIPGQITDEQIHAFARALGDKPGPALAFCKSGTRAASLWALSQAGSQDTDRILRTAAAAGFDLQALEPRLRRGMSR